MIKKLAALFLPACHVHELPTPFYRISVKVAVEKTHLCLGSENRGGAVIARILKDNPGGEVRSANLKEIEIVHRLGGEGVLSPFRSGRAAK
jgi:hypothetical protein